ncbi:hypothetical protein RKD18_007640 [Streptomyces phaeoluteigriseus]
MPLEETAGLVRAVDLEPLIGPAVPLRQAEIVEEGADVEEFGVRVQSAGRTAQRSPEEDAPRVVEHGRRGHLADQCGGFLDQ